LDGRPGQSQARGDGRQLGALDIFWHRQQTTQEMTMAKARKGVATRKKSSKRGKASAKPARKKAAKRAPPDESTPGVVWG